MLEVMTNHPGVQPRKRWIISTRPECNLDLGAQVVGHRNGDGRDDFVEILAAEELERRRVE